MDVTVDQLMAMIGRLTVENAALTAEVARLAALVPQPQPAEPVEG